MRGTTVHKTSLMLSKCDNRKLLNVYRYREKYIDIARKFDTISSANIVSNPVRFDNRESIIISNFIEYR